MEDYFVMYNKFISGEISVTEWSIYCMETLGNLMIENARILKNLKEEA
jgi:hypothetical protein